nr:retrovirus-related Pol polyprotein from transposon TNT 1-94 [Tanacetum cinerariifolium]
MRKWKEGFSSYFIVLGTPVMCAIVHAKTSTGQDFSPEKPTTGIAESTRRDRIDDFSFKKQCSYITLHELPPSRYTYSLVFLTQLAVLSFVSGPSASKHRRRLFKASSCLFCGEDLSWTFRQGEEQSVARSSIGCPFSCFDLGVCFFHQVLVGGWEAGLIIGLGLVEVEARYENGMFSGELAVNTVVIIGTVYHNLYLGEKALVERENVVFVLARPLPYFCLRPPAKGVGLHVADSHTGNHPEDDFTPLETTQRSYSVIRERILFELEWETSSRRGASKELVRNLPKLKFDQHFCNACKIGKQAHASHKAKNIVSMTRCLELLHMDLFDPSVIRSYRGNRYTLVIVDDYSRSLNVTFNETPPPSKTSPLVDDDLDEEEAIKATEKKNLEIDVEDETLEIDDVVNIKESRNHQLENVIGNLNQRTLRSQDQNQSNFFCFISTIEPKNVNEALTNESWIIIMQEKLNQLIANDVWELVTQPKNMTIIGTKWVFRNKLDENGVVSQNKSRLVAQGYNQQEGIDYDETYAPFARAYAFALDFKLF